MPWINKNKYSPGKRHYYVNDIVYSEIKPLVDKYWGGSHSRTETLTQPSLCGNGYRYPLHSTTYGKLREDGTFVRHSGGFSAVDQVDLMQTNLCSYCVKRYINDIRPDLKPAYETLKKGKILT